MLAGCIQDGTCVSVEQKLSGGAFHYAKYTKFEGEKKSTSCPCDVLLELEELQAVVEIYCATDELFFMLKCPLYVKIHL